jgi:hypothetical protein
MLAIVPPANDGATGYTVRIIEGSGPVNSARAFPDLADAATLGALLGLVREEWGALAFPDPTFGGWNVRGARKQWIGVNLGICETTEAGALVAALELASLHPAP